MLFDVPSDASRPMLLEAVCPPARRFDAWEVQVLATVSHLAAVVLEIERARGMRPAAMPLAHDDAAPLIGSTPVMRALRHTVEKVAATDFTILIEGGIGPQSHPDLGIPVCRPGQYQDREVAGTAGRNSM